MCGKLNGLDDFEKFINILSYNKFDENDINKFFVTIFKTKLELFKEDEILNASLIEILGRTYYFDTYYQDYPKLVKDFGWIN